MTALAPRRSLYAAVVGDLLDLIAAQPHQVLISTASVAIVASEAATLFCADLRPGGGNQVHLAGDPLHLAALAVPEP
jgi:hypothetical protein